jgi:hypothetical protein
LLAEASLARPARVFKCMEGEGHRPSDHRCRRELPQ